MTATMEQLKARWQTEDGKRRLKAVVQAAKECHWSDELSGFPFVEEIVRDRDTGPFFSFREQTDQALQKTQLLFGAVERTSRYDFAKGLHGLLDLLDHHFQSFLCLNDIFVKHHNGSLRADGSRGQKMTEFIMKLLHQLLASLQIRGFLQFAGVNA